MDQFRAADFWSLHTKYVSDITDNPSYFLSLSIAGQTKTVWDYRGRDVGMPIEVERLEQAVDQLSGAGRWVVGDARTLPELDEERFKYRSPEGADLLARAMIRAVDGAPYHNARVHDAIVSDLIARGAPLNGHALGIHGDQSTKEIAAKGGRLDLLRRRSS